MASSYQKQESQHEMKQDQLNRLPDDVVLLIINKLFHLKTLLRFSLVSKRYSSLVSQTDSLFVELDNNEPGFLGRVGGFLKNLVAKFTRASSPNILDSDSQKVYAISHGFQQIKHLHVHLFDKASAVEPLETGTFSRSVAAFGSNFEFCHLLMATSVNQSNPSVVGGNDDMHGFTNIDLELLVKMLIQMLKNALKKQNCIRKFLLKCKMLETVVFSDDFLGENFIMGKWQIARLEGYQNQVLADPAELCVFVTYVPTLDLPESGYTMNNVMFVSVIPDDQDAENVEVMDAEAAEEPMDVAFLNDSDLKKWDVFEEAVRQIVNENREPMHVIRVPYSNILKN
ncbi:hypothetical protein REPUB_Repub05bG0118200 [Reevesia pubescens]